MPGIPYTTRDEFILQTLQKRSCETKRDILNSSQLHDERRNANHQTTTMSTTATAPADFKITRITNDSNGNGRLVVHFFALLTHDECREIPSVDGLYRAALDKARKIGGRKYSTKKFGGGIVFTNYESNLRAEIAALLA